MSSGEGVVPPEGWLWPRIIETAFARIAALKTSRGETIALLRFPILTV
jgi:hypothetical protein